MARESQTPLPSPGAEVRLLGPVGRWRAGQIAVVVDTLGANVLLTVDERVSTPGTGGSYDTFLAEPGDLSAVERL